MDDLSEEKCPLWPAVGIGVLILASVIATLWILWGSPRLGADMPPETQPIVNNLTPTEPTTNRIGNDKVIRVQTASNGSLTTTGDSSRSNSGYWNTVSRR